MIRLLLVDDHAVVREGYRRLLERRGDLAIVGEAGDAEAALERLRLDPPDVAIVDLSLPGIGGIELTRRLRQRASPTRVLIFSMHRDVLHAAQALRAGALGYVTKSSAPEVLVQAVYRVARGERVLSPDIAPELALQLLDGDEQTDPTQRLSPREFELLRLLLAGQDTAAIAQALHISPKTVHNGHYQIKTKLGVRNDFELSRLALRWGLLEAPPETD